MMSDFYRAFEDKFRGSREVIKARLKVYLPFIEPLKEIYPDASAVDLGCGRGEWLELLGEKGFSTQGVDLDEGMLATCHGLDIRVQKGEAVAFLKNLQDESQVVVSGFHLVEHIPFDDLLVLVEESLRVLRPAGLLILETPNPENILVGTSQFYIDPTHNRLIPSELLAFLPNYFNFEKVKILRLQEPDDLTNNNNLNLLNVLSDVSPDYAIVAQKNAEAELLDVNKQAFEVEYGVTLKKLATTYNQQVEQRHAELRSVYAELRSVYVSRSWRITVPVRWIEFKGRALKKVGQKKDSFCTFKIKIAIRNILYKFSVLLFKRIVSFLETKQNLRSLIVKSLKIVNLYEKFRRIYIYTPRSSQSNISLSSYNLNCLNPHAVRIYFQLKETMKR